MRFDDLLRASMNARLFEEKQGDDHEVRIKAPNDLWGLSEKASCLRLSRPPNQPVAR